MQAESFPTEQPAAALTRRLDLLSRVGLRLAKEKDPELFLEAILEEACGLCHADGGTLYLRTSADQLAFALVHNRSLGIRLGGPNPESIPFAPLDLFLTGGRPNTQNVATYAAHARELVHVPDAYNAEGFDFSGTKNFDQKSGYRSQSFLTIPLINGEERVIGVLQLINALDEDGLTVIPFRKDDQDTVYSLASQAALALDNQLLLESQKSLLESFIKLIAAAIDSKSPYTGGHCERVPVLTEMIMEAVTSASVGPLAGYSMTKQEWYELRIAAWLHDCGKITTPVHVMDKATKLETICDRIAAIRQRYEILKRDERINFLEAMASGETPALAEARYERSILELNDELAFLERSNIGGEFLSADDQAKILKIGRRTFEQAGVTRALLDEDELKNLLISRGTLTEDERLVINGHMVETIRMLESLPFPEHLSRVPEFAGAHHERMDGKGYPRGLFAGDLSIPARAMAIADVFEALTADDRPYKKAKKLSEAMRIMGFMKRDNHLDPELFDLFVTSGTYRRYAERYLDPGLIDLVDEAALIAIEPKPFERPTGVPHSAREFLPEYEARFPRSRLTSPLG